MVTALGPLIAFCILILIRMSSSIVNHFWKHNPYAVAVGESLMNAGRDFLIPFEYHMTTSSSHGQPVHRQISRLLRQQPQRISPISSPFHSTATQKPSLPIHDAAKRMSLFLMAQKRNNDSEQHLPTVLHQIIAKYADHNDIRNLYHILRSPKDRKQVLGFKSYRAMDQQLPSKRSKIEYLERGGTIRECDYEFTDGVITRIRWRRGVVLTNYFDIQHGMYCVVSNKLC